MLVIVLIAGFLMLFYEAADFFESLFEENPLWMYKTFYVIAYLIVCCLTAGFFACNDDTSLRILIACLAVYWSSRFIKDYFNYREIERQEYEEIKKAEEEEKEKKDV